MADAQRREAAGRVEQARRNTRLPVDTAGVVPHQRVQRMRQRPDLGDARQEFPRIRRVERTIVVVDERDAGERQRVAPVERGDQPLQPLRRVGVVGIQQRDGVAGGEREAAVERDVRARVGLRRQRDGKRRASRERTR